MCITHLRLHKRITLGPKPEYLSFYVTNWLVYILYISSFIWTRFSLSVKTLFTSVNILHHLSCTLPSLSRHWLISTVRDPRSQPPGCLPQDSPFSRWIFVPTLPSPAPLPGWATLVQCYPQVESVCAELIQHPRELIGIGFAGLALELTQLALGPLLATIGMLLWFLFILAATQPTSRSSRACAYCLHLSISS